MDNYIVRVVLTAFYGASLQDVENENGDLERCVCIPIDRNNLKLNPKNNNVSAYFFMNQSSSPNQYGWTHYLKFKLDPNFLKQINELGLENKYCGNAKKGNYIVYKNEYKAKYVKVDRDE
jgi:hypothetical protein